MFQIILGLGILSLLVFVHEWGHFIVARWCGVFVHVFSIGFGKKLVSWKPGNTEYRISMLPFGGYVRLAGQDPDDEHGLVGNIDDAVDLQTAIDMYTVNAAWLMHQEDKTGSIEVGKRADIVVLDRNLFEIPTSEINLATVRITIFDGHIVYKN